MHLTLRHPNRVLLGALMLGICADYFFNNRALGVSVPLFVGLLVSLLVSITTRESRPPSRPSLWFGGLALCFALGVMIRATPLLVVLDLVAIVGFIVLQVALYRGASPRSLPIRRIFDDALRAIGTISFEPMPLISHGARSLPRTRLDRLMPLGRGLLLALPVVGCFGGLLMSADSVFASYIWEMTQLPFDLSLNVMRWLGHLLFVLVATYLCAGVLLAALGDNSSSSAQNLTPADLPPAEGDTQRLQRPRRLGFTEALTVLVAVDILFGSFMLVQAAYFFGGIGTLDRTGMTYANYARRGFFELLMVTCLALGLVWTLAFFTQRLQTWKQRAFNGTSTVLIGMMLGLLASAFQRLLLYEEAYGYTRLRLYTHSFMIWLAIILPIVLIALWRNRPRLFVSGAIVTAILYLGALNIVNTDDLIAQENIARYRSKGKLDEVYLSTLSVDATPALVASLDTLPVNERIFLENHLIRQYHALSTIEDIDGWPSWHVARASALKALRQRFGENPAIPADSGRTSPDSAGSIDTPDAAAGPVEPLPPRAYP
jgi:hypothetical protein